MGKARELDVLTIPVSQLLPGDSFALKGQTFKVWSLEHLEDRKAVPAFNTPAGSLLRIDGEMGNYRASLNLDSRLIIQAVFRDHRYCADCEGSDNG